MNEEDVSKVLGQVVPEAPSPDAWAGAAVPSAVGSAAGRNHGASQWSTSRSANSAIK